MAYVTLDSDGNITGLFANPQPQIAGFAEIADNDARLAAFANPPAAQLAAKRADGITVAANSASVPAATFSLDQTTQSQLAFIAGTAAFLATFPDGATALTYPDASGNPQTFPSLAAFKSFYRAYALLVSQMEHSAASLAAGGPADWPSQTVTPS